MTPSIAEDLFNKALAQGEVSNSHREAFILGALWSSEFYEKKHAPKARKQHFHQKRVSVDCWCENCDVGANIMRTRMSLCPECRDKRCPRALSHKNECISFNNHVKKKENENE